MMRRLALLGPAAISLGAAVYPCSVTIYSDTWGVPHVYAKTDAGAAFGLMYASRTTTSHAMPLINPHIGFFGGGQAFVRLQVRFASHRG